MATGRRQGHSDISRAAPYFIELRALENAASLQPALSSLCDSHPSSLASEGFLVLLILLGCTTSSFRQVASGLSGKLCCRPCCSCSAGWADSWLLALQLCRIECCPDAWQVWQSSEAAVDEMKAGQQDIFLGESKAPVAHQDVWHLWDGTQSSRWGSTKVQGSLLCWHPFSSSPAMNPSRVAILLQHD